MQNIEYMILHNICIIGAGQLGSRHLQGLKGIGKPSNIFVIDPSVESLEVAQERYEQHVGGEVNHRVTYTERINEIPKNIDVAIIATSSKHRCACVEELLKNCNVKYLILEKPLFRTLGEFVRIEQLLEISKVKAWVNCGRRETQVWQDIKNKFKGSKINFEIEGSNWGLMCNAIHYIDIVSYLVNCDTYHVDLAYLDKQLINSKRLGFYEMTGTIGIHFSDGSKLTLMSHDKGSLPSCISISNCDSKAFIFEDMGKIISRKAEVKELVQENFQLSLQSQTTGSLVEKILETGECNLVSYGESMKLHMQIMEPIIEFVNKYTEVKEKIFPFT